MTVVIGIALGFMRLKFRFFTRAWMKLTLFEITILRWVALGRTPAEIAKIEGKSVESINTHLQTVTSRLRGKPLALAAKEASAMEGTRAPSNSGVKRGQGR